MNWDKYFMNLCNVVADNSKCLSRHIGAVIVRNGKFIVSTGYNGPVLGSSHCLDPEYREWLLNLASSEGISYSIDGYKLSTDICPRRIMGFEGKVSQGIEYCQAAHAERNAIDIASRLGISTLGCTMYMNCGIPCIECAKSIVQSGIIEIVVANFDDYEKKGIRGRNILVDKVFIRGAN